jgi:hypothetical protein
MSVAKIKTPCTVKTRSGSDLYGQPIYGDGRKTLCAVINLTKQRKATSIRSESSGTIGHADEKDIQSKLIMRAAEVIELNDFIEVSGMTLRVSSIRHTYNIHGVLGHIVVEGSIE